MTTSVPSSTYRVQLSEYFTLFDAAAIVPYAAELGVGALYISPILQSAQGSTHGYDVVDYTRVDTARGGRAGLEVLTAACREHGIGLVVDIVPNHMSVARPEENEHWWGLLRDGATGDDDAWFDVDWEQGGGRVRLPMLAPTSDFQDISIDGETIWVAGIRLPLKSGSSKNEGTPAAALGAQHYELIEGDRADDDGNYRRFFAVSSLACIRAEEPAVFGETHRELFSWMAEGLVSGVRVDHPDGLADPGNYLLRLQANAPGAWVVVEKILQQGEELPGTWPVAGTTGYDAMSIVTSLFVDPESKGPFDALYRSVTGDELGWPEHAWRAKKEIASTMLHAEVGRIARLFPDVADPTPALEALAASIPIYRTYLPLGERELENAASDAAAREPKLESVFEELLPRLSDPTDEACVRFQQLTGAVMAKGVEDTALYRYTRLIALNEVGSSPAEFGSDPTAFHADATRRQQSAPSSMTTLSTHDTKRGEDIRARLWVLPELIDEWEPLVRELMQVEPTPNGSFGYLLWQTAVATGLIERDRLHSFVEKAMREANAGTSWRAPNKDFEAAVHRAVDGIYEHERTRRLVADFSARIDPYGWSNSLSAKLVQLTMPGVPDCYQGSEYCEDSLVDPDNRRAVDFATLAKRLHSAMEKTPDASDPMGRKLVLTQRALIARRDSPRLFLDYRPIPIRGRLGGHAIAFDRGGAITIATRLPVSLERAGGFDEETVELPPGTYTDVLSGSRVAGGTRLAELLSDWPVALLLSDER